MAKTRQQLKKQIAKGIEVLRLLTDKEFNAYKTVFERNAKLKEEITISLLSKSSIDDVKIKVEFVDICMDVYLLLFNGFLNIDCEQALTNKDGKLFENTLAKAAMFFKCSMDMIESLNCVKSYDQIIACAKKLYDFTLGFERIIKKAKQAGLQFSDALAKDCYAKRLDYIYIMIDIHFKLNQSEKALAYIDEGLHCINYIGEDDQCKGEFRRYFHVRAIINFYKINDLENTIIYLDKYLSIAPSLWKEENTDFHPYFQQIVTKLLNENNLVKAREYCEIMAKSNIQNLVKFAKDKLKKINKKISDLAVQEDKTKDTKKDDDKPSEKNEPDKSSIIVSNNNNAVIVEPTFVTVVAKFDGKAEIDVPFESDNNNINDAFQRKEKVKTRGVAATGTEAIDEESRVISDAEKYGFSKEFANEKIYPLHSNFVPDGVYYAYYPKSNREYQLNKGEHETNERAVEDGIVGAGRSRIRYVGKNKFKVGRKKANSRFFTEIVEQRDGKILLRFSNYHNHKTQSSEYETTLSNQSTVTTPRKGA